jgi:hypothetical protein
MIREKETDMINEEKNFSRPLVHRSKENIMITDEIKNPS